MCALRSLRLSLPIIAWVLAVSPAPLAARDLGYFLPTDLERDASFTTPTTFFGFQPGDWHLRHDQLLAYLEKLSQESPRLTLAEIGRTHEHRPLNVLTVTSPENHARLEEIRQRHLQLADPESGLQPAPEDPVIVYMGYSVHGDESSGANAVPLLAYHLASGQGESVEALLRDTVILIDPCLNPDGFSRFAQWANSHRGRQPVADDRHREHSAVWPGGRTNHYWFDLNRDWLLAQHPESQARLGQFHRWLPHVQTDFHEMGSEATYFFQPGVPERRHPLTPQANVELTQSFAKEHAASLDKIRSLYFTEERFDDFYYGKGSTYPDIHGGVGILFEQASARGHLRESPHGEFDFAFTIRNQVRTSLSTLDAAHRERDRLLQYQQRFFRDALALARDDSVTAYVFGRTADQTRLHAFLELLNRHDIRVHRLAREIEGAGGAFAPGDSYLVPLAQPQYRLIKSLFERRTVFEDNIFYDVSTWTMPLLFALPSMEVEGSLEGVQGEAWQPGEENGGAAASLPLAYAYAIGWTDFAAPKVLHRLQTQDVRVSLTTSPLHLLTPGGLRAFPRGTLIIPAARQDLEEAALREVVREAATGLMVYPVTSGLTPEGPDLGSHHLRPLQPIAPALVVGEGINPYEAGEVWHLLDHRMEMTLPLLESEIAAKTSWEDYTHLLLVDGDYADWNAEVVDRLHRWVKEGGVVVAQKRAARWMSSHSWVEATFAEENSSERAAQGEDGRSGPEQASSEGGSDHAPVSPEIPAEILPLPYGDYDAIEDAKRTSGAFFQVTLDRTHPLVFGYEDDRLAVFRNSNLVMESSRNPYVTPLRYTSDPLLSGYVHDSQLRRFRGSAGLMALKIGKGAVVLLVDNPNFRAIALGTSKLYLNALFFSQVLEAREPQDLNDSAAAQDQHH